MDLLKYVGSVDLTQQGQLQEIKEVLKSDDWRENRNDAVKELAKRKEINDELKWLHSDARKTIQLLWQDPLISFARDIHYSEYLKDLMDDDKKLAAELRRCKIKEELLKPMLFLVGMLLGVSGMFYVTWTQSVIGGIAFLSGGLMMAVGMQLLANRNYDSRIHELERLRDAATAMALVRETEQYKAILELEDFKQMLEHEMELCSWPPI